jgi:large subunit ribosomal protein L24
MIKRFKKGDKVFVLSGKDKGKTGDILVVYPKLDRVLVSGINQVKKHVKPTAQTQGGIVVQDRPIHVSNLSLLDPKTNKPTRVGFSFLSDGQKVRIAKKSGEQIG